jgi:thiol-disulfide isomerase/thioredoxin
VKLQVAGQGPQGETASVTYDIEVTRYNEAIDAGRFTLDTRNSKAANSLQALMQAGAAAAAGQGAGQHPLEGRPAPDVALKTVDGKDYSLAHDPSRVIVLDFWATWCGPCRRGLPLLQEVHDWAKKEGKSVSVYAVNIEETPEQVNRFWAQLKLTLPVLMDVKGEVAQAYRANSIPQTVIISGGRVASVHVGFTPDLATQLKAEIEELLQAAQPN